MKTKLEKIRDSLEFIRCNANDTNVFETTHANEALSTLDEIINELDNNELINKVEKGLNHE